MDVVTRLAAHAAGLTFYFTGEPCRNGHLTKRRVASGACIACLKAAKERFADRTGRQFRRNHGEPERKAAKAAGLIRYSTGQPCRNGHLAERLTSNGKCIVCDAARHAKWLAARPGLEAKWARTRRRADPTASRKAAADWNAKNPERKRLIARAGTQARRARSLEAEGAVSAADFDYLFEKQRGKCAYCSKKAKKMEVDHIQPLIKHRSHKRKNLQLLCRSCNRRKSAKDPLEFAREIGLLL